MENTVLSAEKLAEHVRKADEGNVDCARHLRPSFLPLLETHLAHVSFLVLIYSKGLYGVQKDVHKALKYALLCAKRKVEIYNDAGTVLPFTFSPLLYFSPNLFRIFIQVIFFNMSLVGLRMKRRASSTIASRPTKAISWRWRTSVPSSSLPLPPFPNISIIFLIMRYSRD